MLCMLVWQARLIDVRAAAGIECVHCVMILTLNCELRIESSCARTPIDLAQPQLVVHSFIRACNRSIEDSMMTTRRSSKRVSTRKA